jgi:hypothetical protein
MDPATAQQNVSILHVEKKQAKKRCQDVVRFGETQWAAVLRAACRKGVASETFVTVYYNVVQNLFRHILISSYFLVCLPNNTFNRQIIEHHSQQTT